jgi:Glycosyltransferase family 87
LDVAFPQRKGWPLTTWENVAWATWIGILVFLCVRSYLHPTAKTVYPAWSSTSDLFWSGGELYKPYRPLSVQGGFRYSPAFPILVTPFAIFPDAVGGVLWRCFCIAIFAAAVGWWLRVAVPVKLTRDQVAQLYLLLLPLSIQSMSNGQANVPVTALLLGTVAAVKQERWNWASLFAALTFICKLYPLALGLVLCVLYPRKLAWRIPLIIVLLLAVPFLVMPTDYVVDQYGKWFSALQKDDRSTISWDQMYRDLWLLICAVGAPISRGAYEVFQVVAGAAVAGLCWYRQRQGWPTDRLLSSTLALTTTWMLLLGPTSESCTFIMLAPALAWAFAEARRSGGWSARRGLLLASGAFFFTAMLMGIFPRAVNLHSLGVHPIATLFFLAYLLTERHPEAARASVSNPSIRAAA